HVPATAGPVEGAHDHDVGLGRNAKVAAAQVLRTAGCNRSDMSAVAIGIARDRARSAVGHIDRGENATAVVLRNVLPETRIQYGYRDALAGNPGLLQDVRADEVRIVSLIQERRALNSAAVRQSRLGGLIHDHRRRDTTDDRVANHGRSDRTNDLAGDD